jgi:putative tryptophan/tyrosine transport system substrate-binding protein
VRRRDLIMLFGALAAWPRAAAAQKATAQRRVIGLVNSNEGDQTYRAFVQALVAALRKLGWEEGRNIKVEYRWIPSDVSLIEQAAEEAVALQPDLIFAVSSPGTAALLHHTRTIPVLFINIIDPVGQGFVTSLSRPGGNATGFVNFDTSMAGKWIELLKQVMPQVTRVAVPYSKAGTPYAQLFLNYYKSSAQSFGVEIIDAPVADMAAFETFVAAQAQPNTGLIPVPASFTIQYQKEIAEIAIRHHLPAISFNRAFAEVGGLMAYGNEIIENFRRAADYVDRILKGEKPSELPIQFPVKFELVINLKTANTLGLTVPATLLALADEVIE